MSEVPLYTLHPTPYTLHPTPYTLHPTPCTPLPTPYTLHPTPYTLHPTPYTPNSRPSTLTPPSSHGIPRSNVLVPHPSPSPRHVISIVHTLDHLEESLDDLARDAVWLTARLIA